MWLQGRFSQLTGSLPAFKWRKVCLAAILILVVFGYIGPLVIHHGKTTQVTMECLGTIVTQIEKEYGPSGATILHAGRDPDQPKVLPLVGNGYLEFIVDHTKPYNLHLRGDSWVADAPYRPLLRVKIDGYTDQRATIVNYRKGMVEHIQCYYVQDSCVQVKVTTFAHRTREAILYQEVEVENTASVPVTLLVSRNGPSHWKGSGTSNEIFEVNGKSISYVISTGKFPAPYVRDTQGQHYVALVIVATDFDKRVEIQPNSRYSKETITVTRFSEPVLDIHADTDVLASLTDKTEEELFSLLHLDFRDILDEHLSVWSNSMWNSKLLVEPLLSSEESPNVPHLTTELVTATFFYMMSSVKAPLLVPGLGAQEKKGLVSALQRPQSCFNGQPTFNNAELWKQVEKAQELQDLVSHWMHTLYKHGCSSLLSAGVTGVTQAMLLSIFSAQFTDKELSFHADPAQLKGRFLFQNILYNSSYLQINIDPSGPAENQKVTMRVSHSQNQEERARPLFACGSGCLQALQLTEKDQKLDLKWTEPQTPFLYVSHDRKHLEYLQHIIHFKKLRWLDEIPAKTGEDHHGFQVPMLVWVVLISLIICFHFILFKMIWNEYCRDSPTNWPKSKFNAKP
ncbi:uncharacterized protein KIAA2013 homolog [Diadema antillarum]|uniref:uncharacterized protein KIAA2013 homolog n=1 Tax=Diadema antillarum TaxID=105358 RepID=UPI003A85E3AD